MTSPVRPVRVGRGARLAAWLPASAVFLLAILQYLITVPFDFAWDDKLVITANEYTKKGIAGIPEFFTKRVSVPYKSEYRPVPQTLFAIEYQVSGGSPHAAHVMSVVWYAFTCVAVYYLVGFLFPEAGWLFALLAATLFTVHPIHVEVVANIKGRDEILALFFGILALIMLVKTIEQPRWTCFLAGVVCLAAAFLSKMNSVTLLPLVPLVVWWRGKSPGGARRLARSTAAIALLCLTLILCIRYLQNTAADDLPLHLNSTVLNNIFLWTAHPKTIVPTALVIIARYALLMLYPHTLIHLYGYDQIPLSRRTDLAPWLVLAALVAIGVFAYRTWSRKSPLTFGLIWIALTYSVYSNLFFYAPDTMADRYMFLPSVGFAVIVVYLLFLLSGMKISSTVIKGVRSGVAVSLFGLLCMAYFARSLAASQDWRNDSTLIHNRIAFMERNAAAQAIYGHTLLKESTEISDPAARRKRKSEAMQAFTKAIAIYPDFQAAWIAIGKLFAERGSYDKAELSFLKAQTLEPLSSESYLCLGTLYLAEQDPGLAIPYLEKAVLLDPKNEEGYVMLGKAYLRIDNLENLGSMLITARRWFPENIDLLALDATSCFRRRQYEKAFRLARDVTKKAPGNLLAQTILSSPAAQEFPGK